MLEVSSKFSEVISLRGRRETLRQIFLFLKGHTLEDSDFLFSSMRGRLWQNVLLRFCIFPCKWDTGTFALFHVLFILSLVVAFWCLDVMFRTSGDWFFYGWYMAMVYFPLSSLRWATTAAGKQLPQAGAWWEWGWWGRALKMLGHRRIKLHKLLLSKPLKEDSAWTQTFLSSWFGTFSSLVLRSQRWCGIKDTCLPLTRDQAWKSE